MHFFSIFLVFWTVLCLSNGVQSSAEGEHFEMCYDDENCSPNHWPGTCKNGKQQSPINLKIDSRSFPTNATKHSGENFKELKHSKLYFQMQNFTLTNNGHTAQLSLNEDLTSTTYMSGSLVGGNYTLSQLHFHWGNGKGHGSEHMLNNIQYAMEVHFVHFATEKGSLSAALNSHMQGAVTVVGLFFQLMKVDNPALDPIIDGMGNVQNASSKTNGIQLKLSNFFRYSPSPVWKIVRYHGSLTTPPCTEGITWILIANPIQISPRQLEAFDTRLSTHKNTRLTNNNRNIQNPDGSTVNYHVEYLKSSIWKGL